MTISNQVSDFSVTLRVDRTPAEAFAAINDVRSWWSGEIEGETDRADAVFTYRYRDLHRSTQRVAELVPGRKVVWQVVDSHLSFLEDKHEWTGTEVVFEISERDGQTEIHFTHRGLTRDSECYGACSSGWSSLINGNLRDFIATGGVQPDVFA
jgi:hypothetical protein